MKDVIKPEDLEISTHITFTIETDHEFMINERFMFEGETYKIKRIMKGNINPERQSIKAKLLK